MTIITEGIWLEMIDRRKGRVIFSASTDELDKDIFDQLWSSIGDMIHRKSIDGGKSRMSEFEIRISRHRLSHD